MKLGDAKDEAEKSMDRFITGTVAITKDNMRLVYKKMIALNDIIQKEDSGKKYITPDELWDYIQKNTKPTDKGAITDIYQMKKAVVELEEKGRIMIGEDNDFIYLFWF